jgi:hypothetical protein
VRLRHSVRLSVCTSMSAVCLCTFVCATLCVCAVREFECLYVYQCVCQSVRLSVCTSKSLCLSLCVCVRCVSLYDYQCVCISLHQSVRSSVCTSLSASECQSLCTFVSTCVSPYTLVLLRVSVQNLLEMFVQKKS